MAVWPFIISFALLVLIESLTVRWIAGSHVPNLVSRIIATNLTGLALLLLVTMTGWFFGWWPDIRNWAFRDSFFLYLILKAPIFAFLFRRWGTQKIFTLHVLSSYASVLALSALFIYSPQILGIKPITAEFLNNTAIARLRDIREAVESYHRTYNYYPDYIWGGDALSWGSGNPSPDPLLNEGYLLSYPVNPLNLRRTFFEPRRLPGLKALWFGYKSTDFLYLRNNLWMPIVESDPRFGYRGNKMGNVLPDPRMPETNLPDEVRFSIEGKWLPGSFFYRSFDLNTDGFADAYMLGVCGIENGQATVDCYDARLDRVTSDLGGITVPTANDGIRDGVIFICRTGFDKIPPFEEPVGIIPRMIDPVTGEPVAGIPDITTESEPADAGKDTENGIDDAENGETSE